GDLLGGIAVAAVLLVALVLALEVAVQLVGVLERIRRGQDDGVDQGVVGLVAGLATVDGEGVEASGHGQVARGRRVARAKPSRRWPAKPRPSQRKALASRMPSGQQAMTTCQSSGSTGWPSGGGAAMSWSSVLK